MRYRIRVASRAAEQIREAADWWLENRPKAPGACADEIERGFELICSLPAAGEPVRHRKYRTIRRLLLGRISYYLYYRINRRKEEVEVLALWHTSRGRAPRLGSIPSLPNAPKQ